MLTSTDQSAIRINVVQVRQELAQPEKIRVARAIVAVISLLGLREIVRRMLI